MLTLQMMQKHENQRTDEYGGSLENRTRLLRELLEVTRDAVGDDAAVALRIAADELDDSSNISGARANGEMRDIIESLAPLPDLWDVCLHSWKNDSQTSRFAPIEGYQENYVRYVREIVSRYDRPVVGVGRFTSPDAMVEQLRTGVLDMIGAGNKQTNKNR